VTVTRWGTRQRPAAVLDGDQGQQHILDDASGSELIRPLLPGSGDSVVLVTSRRRLTALDDARTISLDTLPPGCRSGWRAGLA
jgi:hypothetical protein